MDQQLKRHLAVALTTAMLSYFAIIIVDKYVFPAPKKE